MTDNEIIKALECCANHNGCYRECPYDRGIDDEDMARCTSELSRDALDLINRQKAEIEKKDIEIDILIRKKEALNDDVSKLRTEIEILTSERDCLAKMEHDNLYEQTQKIRKAKAEAIKEFAERLKEHTTTATFGQGKYSYEIVTERSIDNLVKEMVGDAE